MEDKKKPGPKDRDYVNASQKHEVNYEPSGRHLQKNSERKQRNKLQTRRIGGL